MRRSAMVILLVSTCACGRVGFSTVERDDAAEVTEPTGDGGRPASDAEPVPATCPPGCSESEYCATPEGACGGQGTCQPRPGGCLPEDAPVCACDGLTYMNACFAAAAGIGVAAHGACATASPLCDPPCGPSDYCATTACLAPGTCTPKPPETAECVPGQVCGCDGNTYPNICGAYQAGVDSLHTGPCLL